MRPAILLALSASTPPLIPRRASGSLSLDDKLLAKEKGRIGYDISLQNLVDRGEAATLEDAKQILSSRGHVARLQNMVDRGDAADLEEAATVVAQEMRATALQNMVDRGEAATLKEAAKMTGQRRRAAALQSMVDRGEAATLKEAAKMSGQRMRATALQSMVDRGEAATLKEAQTVLSARGYAASLERLIESGEAVTLEEARKMQAASGRAASAAKDPLGVTGLTMHGGVAAAIKTGKYTRFPGVRWRKDSRKWRVQFSVKGKKVSLGSYASEEEAAHVHDEFVRTNDLSRPLHFPQSGEASSNVFRERVEKVSRKEELP